MSEISPWQVFTGKSKLQLDSVILQADLMGKHRQLWAQSPRTKHSFEITIEKDWLSLPSIGNEKPYLSQSTEHYTFTSNWVRTFPAQERDAKFETCNRLREENTQTPLEMTNNGHSSPQEHNFTHLVRNFLSKLAQNARAWERQERHDHIKHSCSLYCRGAHFFK